VQPRWIIFNEVETKNLCTVRYCSTSNKGLLFCSFEVYRASRPSHPDLSMAWTLIYNRRYLNIAISIEMTWDTNCNLPRLWRHAYPTMDMPIQDGGMHKYFVWNEMKWNEMKWNEMKWNEMKWNEMKWSAMKCNIFYTKNDKNICDKILKLLDHFQTDETYCYFPLRLLISVQLRQNLNLLEANESWW
jgi:hypothetical protein